MRNSFLNLDNHTQSPNPDSIASFAKHFLTIPAHLFNILNTGCFFVFKVTFANLYLATNFTYLFTLSNFFEIQKHA